MVQRIFNVTKWMQLEEGKVCSFSNPRKRIVRVDVNSPGDSELYYVGADHETRFLALVRGRDMIEFTSDGAFSIAVNGNDCWIHTPDGEDISHEVLDPIIFTRIAERRARNPELMAIEARMMQNIFRRMEAMKLEAESYAERAQRRYEHQREHADRLARERVGSEPESDDDAERTGDEDAGTDRGRSGAS